MRRSIATVSLSGTLNEKLTAVANAGFDGVEIFDQDLLCSLWTPRRIRERCDELGLKIEMLQPFRMVGSGPWLSRTPRPCNGFSIS